MAAVALLPSKNLFSTTERAENYFHDNLRTESRPTVLGTDNESTASSLFILRELTGLDMECNDFGLKLGSILQSQQHYEEFASGLKGKDRKSLIEFLDKALDSRAVKNDSDWYRRGLRALRQMCGIMADLPASHLVDETELSNRDEQILVAGGGSADIYLGKYKTTRVAIKRFRIYETDDLAEAYASICHEVVVWKRFSHPNVLPFLGVSEVHNQLYTLSEWMENGNVNDYLKKCPETNRLQLLLGVAKGLEYLHDESVIHGDLKGANIVVDTEGSPLLTDFGLSSIMVGPVSIVSRSLGKGGGTARWMAPELCDSEDEDIQVISTTEADIYAFSMVLVEVFTGAIPFAHIPNHDKVVHMMCSGTRPTRPENAKSRGLTDEVWGIAQKCWVKYPCSRMRAFQVVAGLQEAVTDFSRFNERNKADKLLNHSTASFKENSNIALDPTMAEPGLPQGSPADRTVTPSIITHKNPSCGTVHEETSGTVAPVADPLTKCSSGTSLDPVANDIPPHDLSEKRGSHDTSTPITRDRNLLMKESDPEIRKILPSIEANTVVSASKGTRESGGAGLESPTQAKCGSWIADFCSNFFRRKKVTASVQTILIPS